MCPVIINCCDICCYMLNECLCVLSRYLIPVIETLIILSGIIKLVISVSLEKYHHNKYLQSCKELI